MSEVTRYYALQFFAENSQQYHMLKGTGIVPTVVVLNTDYAASEAQLEQAQQENERLRRVMQTFVDDGYIREVAVTALAQPPYPEFCRHKAQCAGKASCPEEPGCAE